MPDYLTSEARVGTRRLFASIAGAVALASLGLVAAPQHAGAHGLISDPPSRNWTCGAVTKPDQARNTKCADAFKTDQNGGYQFMRVLTHGPGKLGASSRNVCGFDSETWRGGASPWDGAADWPTTQLRAGRVRITWNISWGPHFDDTTDFRYWITKPSFKFDPNRPLSWSDFEPQPFCNLRYQDKQPNANPDVVADKGKALFHTTCNVPQRQGHHVIYGEWGRGPSTYERFHGCIDATF